MAQNTSPSHLDAHQIVRREFDDANDAQRVNIVASIPSVEGATAAPGAAPPAVSKVVAGIDGSDLVRTLRTDANGELQVDVLSSALPTGATTEATLLALSNKSAGSLVSEDFDYQSITYVGATSDINTVVYKIGGAGGSTVATLTMAYDGSNRLSSVTKT